jgi:hypothetical protein
MGGGCYQYANNYIGPWEGSDCVETRTVVGECWGPGNYNESCADPSGAGTHASSRTGVPDGRGGCSNYSYFNWVALAVDTGPCN